MTDISIYDNKLKDLTERFSSKLIGQTYTFKEKEIKIESVKKINFTSKYAIVNDKYGADFDKISNFDSIYNTFENDIKEISEILNTINNEKLEAKKAEEAAKQLEIEEAKNKIKSEEMLKKLDLTYRSLPDKSKNQDFYRNLGWLAKNSNLSANIPDFCQNWFEKTFGPDAKKTVVSTLQKSAGGYLKKFAPAFTISLSNIETAPDQILYIFKNRKKLNDTQYVFSLIVNYGFKFGKQDLEDILKNIPNDMIPYFEEGYNV